MSISKSYPELILIVKVNDPIVGFSFSIFSNISNIIYYILVIEIMNHRRHYIDRPINNKNCTSGLSWSYFLISFVKSFQILVELLSQSLTNFALSLILNIWKFIVACANSKKSMSNISLHFVEYRSLNKVRVIVNKLENRQGILHVKMKDTIVEHVEV
jgi:hypothetical protein